MKLDIFLIEKCEYFHHLFLEKGSNSVYFYQYFFLKIHELEIMMIYSNKNF